MFRYLLFLSLLFLGCGPDAEQRANSFVAMGQPADAAREFSNAIKANPTKSDLYKWRGFCLIDLAKHDEAIADFSEAIRLNPADKSSYILRARSYVALNKLPEAITDCSEAIRLDSQDTNPLRLRGQCYAGLQQFDQAIADFSEVIRLDPSHAFAHCDRAKVYSVQKRYDEALADYTQSMQNSPWNRELYLQRAVCFAQLGRDAEAIADCTEGLKGAAIRDVEHLFQLRATLLLRQDKPEAAISDLSEKIRVSPDEPTPYLQRALAHAKLGQYDQALADYDKAIQLGPDSHTAYWNRGRLFFILTRFGEAVDDLNEAIRLAPSFSPPVAQLAWLYATCPDPAYLDGAKAVELAKRGLQDNNPFSFEVLAAAYAESGDFESAVKAQTEAIELTTGEPAREKAKSRLALYETFQPYRSEFEDPDVLFDTPAIPPPSAE